MALRIQLALQGGGAKISTLMALMESVQLLESEGVLKVSRIAGTSAGSLIGCLFAAGIKMETLRASLVAGVGKSLVALFPPPKLHRMVIQPISGRPFWSTKALEKGLGKLFSEQGVSTLSDLKTKTGTEVLLVAANLGTGSKEVFRDTDDIISSIISSCGLPYFFRTWDKGGRAGNVIVDGGICENLPSTELVDSPDEPVVAITFQPTRPGTPNNVTSFTLAILETAMNNSIERAKRALHRNSIHTIETDIATFDFQRGLEYGLQNNDAYNLVKERADKFFRKFVQDKLNEQEANAAALKRIEQEEIAKQKAKTNVISEQSAVGGDLWAAQNATTIHLMRQMAKVYDVQHANSKFKYLKCSFVVQANCLLEKGETLYGVPDWFSYKLQFQAVDEPIYCVSVALTETPQASFLGETKWTVRDVQNNLVESIDVPIEGEDGPKRRELMLFFNPVLKPNSGQYTLLFQDQALGLMQPLLTENKDELEFYPRRAHGKIDRIDLLLHIPARLKDSIYMQARPGPIPGRKMLEGELADYNVPVGGFFTLGWTGENLAVEDNFGVDLLRK